MHYKHLNAILLGVLGAALALAQVNGTVSGRVDDSSGSPVDSATVALKSTETGATRTDPADPARGTADDEGVGGDVTGDDCAGSDRGKASNVGSGDHHGSGTDG